MSYSNTLNRVCQEKTASNSKFFSSTLWEYRSFFLATCFSRVAIYFAHTGLTGFTVLDKFFFIVTSFKKRLSVGYPLARDTSSSSLSLLTISNSNTLNRVCQDVNMSHFYAATAYIAALVSYKLNRFPTNSRFPVLGKSTTLE